MDAHKINMLILGVFFAALIAGGTLTASKFDAMSATSPAGAVNH